MIKGRRSALLVAALLAASVGGCDWFDSTPTRVQNVRPGVERQIAPSTALPTGGSHSYDASVTPIDENARGGQIGSIVTGKGGQKAQQDALKKQEAERDAKTRAEREREASNTKAPDGEGPPSQPV